MKPLIIYAHPKTGGHCAAIFNEVKEQLDAAKIKYDAVDLYKMKYDPILHENEHYVHKDRRDIAKENLKFQKMIDNTDQLIFIYPVWWGGTPAILKGWFDRVLTAPWAFQYKRHPILSKIIGGPVPEGHLKGKKAAIFYTSGAKRWQTVLFQGDRSRKVAAIDTLGFCGVKAKGFQIAHAGRFDESRMPEIEKTVRKALRWLI